MDQSLLAVDDEGRRRRQQGDSEVAFDLALKSLLSTGSQDDGLHRPLAMLAHALQVEHRDAWLSDFLGSPSSRIANALLERAIHANNTGTFQSAYQLSASAETIYRARRNDAGVGMSRFQKIYALHRQARSNQCIKIASSDFLNFLRFHRYRWLEAATLIESSICQSMTSNFDGAELLIKTAHRSARHDGYAVLAMRALGMEAAFTTAEGRLSDSWQTDWHGLSQFWSSTSPGERGFQFASDLSLVAEAQHMYYFAAIALEEGLNMLGAEEHPEIQAVARSHVAQLFSAVGDLSKANRELLSSIAILRRLPSGPATNNYEAAANISLAHLDLRLGNPASAEVRLNRIIPLINAAGTFTIPMDYFEAEIQLQETRGDRIQERRFLRQALALGAMGERHLKSETDRWYWGQQMTRLYRRVVELNSSPGTDAALTLERWRSFQKQLHLQPSPTRNSAGDGEAHGRIPPRTILVTFMVGPSGIHVWGESRGHVVEEVISTKPEHVRYEVKRFLALCSDPSSSIKKVKRSGSRLYEWLLAPVFAKIGVRGSRIIEIEPDDFLASIPWSALSGSDGSFLGEKYIFVNSSGSPAGQETGWPQPVLLVDPGASSFNGSNYPTLPDAEFEIEQLASVIGGSTTLTGKNADAARILHDLPAAGTFHFAGHALSRWNGGELLTHGTYSSGMITAAQIRALRFRKPSLVVLSACSTFSDLASGNSPDGLVTAFFEAGATRVIATRWEIDSSAAKELMAAFYSELRNGSSIAAAIAHAKRFIAKNTATAHPYYWSSFDLFAP